MCWADRDQHGGGRQPWRRSAEPSRGRPMPAALPWIGAPRASLLERLNLQLEAEHDRWFLWLPVLFGTGIAFYFLLPTEPPLLMAVLPAAAALALYLAGRRMGLAGAAIDRAAYRHARRGCRQAAHGNRARAGAGAADRPDRRLRLCRAGGAARHQRPAADHQRHGHGKARGAPVAGAGAHPHARRERRTQAGRRGAPEGDAQPAAGTVAAWRLRFCPRGLVFRLGGCRLRQGGGRDRSERGRTSPGPAGGRRRSPGAPGHRPAGGGGAARGNRRHRQRADHGRARRHHRVHQPGVP